jgi:hypothetical protein
MITYHKSGENETTIEEIVKIKHDRDDWLCKLPVSLNGNHATFGLILHYLPCDMNCFDTKVNRTATNVYNRVLFLDKNPFDSTRNRRILLVTDGIHVPSM